MQNEARFNRKTMDRTLMFHHLILLLMLPVYFMYEKGDFYITCMFLSGATTPFLHARYMMKKSGMQGTLALRLCSITLVILYFMMRIVMWPVLFTVHSRSIGVAATEVYKHVSWYCLIVSFALMMLSIAWWAKLVVRVVTQDLRAKLEPDLASSCTKED